MSTGSNDEQSTLLLGGGDRISSKLLHRVTCSNNSPIGVGISDNALDCLLHWFPFSGKSVNDWEMAVDSKR